MKDRLFCLNKTSTELGKVSIRALPPASIRYHANGSRDLYSFLEVGKQCKSDIIEALKKINRNLDSFHDILDFGCGCGRTLLWLARPSSPSLFYGTDIDADAISWCQKNLKFIKCDTNAEVPPLKYPSSSFDLVYAISVFSHITEDYQFRWLDELKRIMKPSGILLISLHGRNVWEKLPQEYIDKIEKNGFVFRKTGFWKNIFPEWYEDAYHTEQYVRDEYSKYFKVLHYIPKGIGNHQDLVVLQNA